MTRATSSYAIAVALQGRPQESGICNTTMKLLFNRASPSGMPTTTDRWVYLSGIGWMIFLAALLELGWKIAIDSALVPIDSHWDHLAHSQTASMVTVLAIVAVVHVARLRRTDLAIRTEHLFESQLNVATITVVRVDRTGRILAVNAGWRRFARNNGANDETIHGVGLDYLASRCAVPLSGVSKQGDLLAEVIAGRRASFSDIYPCHSDRVVRWFRVDASRAADDNGAVISHTDITEHQNALGQTSVLKVIADALAARAPFSESCRIVSRTACQAFTWDMAVVWRQDHDGSLSCTDCWSPPDSAMRVFEDATRASQFRVGEGVPGNAWVTRTPNWISDLPTALESSLRERTANDVGLRTAVVLPICCGDEVLAVIELFSRIQREPDYALLELLSTSGSQLASQVTLQRAEHRLHEAEKTEQQSLLEANEQRRLLEQVLDALPDLVVLKGPESQLLWANAALRTLYSMSNEDLHGLVDAPFNEPNYTEQYVLEDAQVFSTGAIVDIPNEPVTRFDGDVRRFHTIKSPIFDEAGNVVKLVSVCHDITDSLRLEEELRLTARLASVGTLAAGVAHEINTPVQFIGDSVHFLREASQDLFGFVDALQHVQRVATHDHTPESLAAAVASAEDAEAAADLPYLVEHVPKAFARCIDGLERVGTIVRSLKEFAHPAQHGMVAIDLNRAIGSTLTIAHSEYKYVAELVRDFGELPMVTCSVDDINQVVLNLVVNATHAITDVVKGSETKGTITVCTRCEGDDVVIFIRDSGGGIPESARPRIFEPFFTTKPVGQGTGQGLALAWSIVCVKHGGQLTFDTEVGVGTTFCIKLPLDGKPSAMPSTVVGTLADAGSAT